MGHYDSCREPSLEETVVALQARISDLETRLRSQTAATVSAAETAEAALTRLIAMQPVVDEAVLVVDRTTLPPPRLLAAVRQYQAGRS